MDPSRKYVAKGAQFLPAKTLTQVKSDSSPQLSTTSSSQPSPPIDIPKLRKVSRCSLSTTLLPYFRHSGKDSGNLSITELNGGTKTPVLARAESVCLNSTALAKISKTWSETENDLDVFLTISKPRRLRIGMADPPQPPGQPGISLKLDRFPTPDKQVIYLERSNRKQTSLPKLYVNLPKLPFGKHLSYNEEINILSKFVTKETEAMKRHKVSSKKLKLKKYY